MRRAIGTGVAAVGLAALALSAAPAIASAAPLPEGDRIYALTCTAGSLGTLYELDVESVEATPVGDWVNPDTSVFSCAGPGAFHPTERVGYWISWVSSISRSYLISVDLETGVNTNIGLFTLDDEPYYTPLALAIDGEGRAWATSFVLSDVLFSVDLETAELTVVGPTGLMAGANNYGLAWDPVTDEVYGYNTFTRDLYLVDTATGAFTLFAEDFSTSLVPYALAFDSAGQLWGINGDVVSASLSALDEVEFFPFGTDNAVPYSESIIIAWPEPEPTPPPTPAPTPGPALAATGSDGSLSGLLALGGGAFLALGAVVAARRTRQS